MSFANLQLTPVRIAIAVTVAITAVIHIILGEPLLILNGVGYLALWAAAFLPLPLVKGRQGMLRLALGGYTLLTIILYFVFHADGSWQSDGLGIATKFDEVLLLVLLLYDSQMGGGDAGAG